MSTNTARAALVKPATSEFYDVTIFNSNADKIDNLLGFTPATSSTRPSTPINGQGVLESDTGSAIVSNGSSPASASWNYLHGTGGPTTVGATGATAALRIQTTSTISGNRCVDFRKSGDANSSFICDFDGKMQWGPGGGTSPDTNLYRSAAATLKTDQNLVVAGNVTIAGNGVVKPLAGVLVVTAGTLLTTSGTTEADVTNLDLTSNITVKSGNYYRLNLNIAGQATTNADDFQFRIRRTTTLTGTVVGDFRWIVASAAVVNDQRTWSVIWKCPSGSTTEHFYVSVQRVLGSGTMVVQGDSKSCFWIEDMGSDAAVWSTS
jgi:hypothetical protein